MIYLCTDINFITEENKNLLLSSLPPKEAARVLARFGDQLEALVAYSLLFSTTDQKELSRDSFGKPYFENAPHVHFSISHAKGASLMALSSAPIGVDIESENRTLSQKALERICSEEEFLQYKDADSKTKITLWTLKEAYGKYKGKGISLPLSAVSFRSLQECSDPSVLIQSQRHNGFVCSVCSETKEQIIPISVSELVEKLKS